MRKPCIAACYLLFLWLSSACFGQAFTVRVLNSELLTWCTKFQEIDYFFGHGCGAKPVRFFKPMNFAFGPLQWYHIATPTLVLLTTLPSVHFLCQPF